MSSNPFTLVDVVIRHPRERKSKCSLEPLRTRNDLRFLNASDSLSFDATGYLLLCLDAPVVSSVDRNLPILLLDSTWRLLPQVESTLTGSPVRRSLPAHIHTAYPRKSKITSDPSRGLASVEALFTARLLQGRSVHGLLDQYHWKEPFLTQFEQD